MQKKGLVRMLSVMACTCCMLGVTACGGEDSQAGNSTEQWGTTFTVATAYAKAQSLGYEGSMEEFLASIQGANGKDGVDGVGITDASINENGELVLSFTQGEPVNLGKVVGEDGKDGEDGVGITGASINANGELILTFSKGEPVNLGKIVGTDGTDGISITGVNINENGELILTFSKGEPVNLGKIVDKDTVDGTEGLAYKLSQDQSYYMVTGIGMAEETDVVIPSTYKGKPVKMIYDEAFSRCNWLTSIVIPDSVTSIGEKAFYYCGELRTAIIGNGVERIEDYAFESCQGLRNLTIGNSVTSIGEMAFYQCSMTRLIIPDSVKIIEQYAFQECTPLLSITLGTGIESIGHYAFGSCHQLLEVVNKSKFAVTAGVVEENNGHIGEYAKHVVATEAESNFIEENGYTFYNDNGQYLLCRYSGQEVDVVLPTQIQGQDQTYEIYFFAFGYCDNIKSMIIPENVTKIGMSSFVFCANLESITIPASVTSIGSTAFYECNLATVDYMGTIDSWAMIEFESEYANPLFYGATLYINGKEVTQAHITTATYISAVAFAGYTNLTSVVIGDSVLTIGDYAFEGCNRLQTVYYGGTADAWAKISIGGSNGNLPSATVYYYVENAVDVPTDGGNYWHYDNGVPTAW